MQAFLIFSISLSSAYLACRLNRHAPFTLADVLIGLFSGTVSFGMIQFLSVEGAAWDMGMPLLLATGLTLALESFRRRPLFS